MAMEIFAKIGLISSKIIELLSVNTGQSKDTIVGVLVILVILFYWLKR